MIKRTSEKLNDLSKDLNAGSLWNAISNPYPSQETKRFFILLKAGKSKDYMHLLNDNEVDEKTINLQLAYISKPLQIQLTKVWKRTIKYSSFLA